MNTEQVAGLTKRLSKLLKDPQATSAAILTAQAAWLSGLMDQSHKMHQDLERVSPFGKPPMRQRLDEWLKVTDSQIELFNAEVEERVNAARK